MAGRIPKPTHLHAVEGTFNVTKHGRDRENEPEPTGTPVKPASLRGKASKIWDETIERATWLKSVDSVSLAMWCKLAAELDGSLKNVPSHRITAFRTLGSELGLAGPGTRSRIRVKTSGKTEDPAEQYFA